MSPSETAMALRILQAAYPHVQVSEETIELWINTFSGDDAVTVMTGCRVWVENESRWPTPADIRRFCRDVARREQMEAPPTREIASGPYPTFEEGIQIAYNSYCHEVRRQGREPKPFEQFRHSLGGVDPKARKHRAYR